jgi:hypothetical protein
VVRSQVAEAPCLYAHPIKAMYYGHPKYLVSDAASSLDAFRAYPLGAWLPGSAKMTTGRLEAPVFRSSRTKNTLSSDTNTSSRYYRTASRRT